MKNSLLNQLSSACSKMSKLLFDEFDKYLFEHDTYYASKNGEYMIRCKDKIMLIDYFIKDLNIAIEFNGDYWHANPNRFNADDIIGPTKMTAEQMWEKDKERYKLLEENYGIKTYVIWESEYNTPEFDVQKFITETLKITL